MTTAQGRADEAAKKAEGVDQRLTRLWTNRFNQKQADSLEVYFSPDSIDLTDAAQTALLAVVREMEAHPTLTVELGGYTDPRGALDYNYGLSQRRVDAVRRFLQILVNVDRTKAELLGVPVSSVFGALQAHLGAQYVGDFNLYSRVFQVQIEDDATFRDRIDRIYQLYVRSDKGAMVPLRSLVEIRLIQGPQALIRYNNKRAVVVTGGPAPGISSGQAQAAMLSFNDIFRMLTVAMVLLIPSFLLLQRARAGGRGIASH